MKIRSLPPTTCLLVLLSTSHTLASTSFEVIVTNNTITLGSDTSGFLQVQEASTWRTLCTLQLPITQGNANPDNSCIVEPGVYNVLNFATRQRINGIVVGQQNGRYTAPELQISNDNSPLQVIAADSVFSTNTSIQAPENLRGQVYSRTALEVFWDRSSVPGLQYNILSDGVLLGSTNGTSFFVSGLSAGQSINIDVNANNSSGVNSEQSSITLQTIEDETTSSAPSLLATPTGFRAEVYSSNTIELFWDRQSPGQQFEVRDSNGTLLSSTNGTSFFIQGLVDSVEHIFELTAIDGVGGSSTPATISIRTTDPAPDSAITIAGAEALLAQVISIANRDLFTLVESSFDVGVDAVRAASSAFVFDGITTSTNGLTHVEGTGGGASASNFGGFSGGEFTCNAGGSAEGISILGGETSNGYIIALNDCALNEAGYTGEASFSSGGRSGFVTRNYSDIEFTPHSSDISFQYNSDFRFEIPFRNSGNSIDRLIVSQYVEIINGQPDGIQVFDFESNQLGRLGQSFRDDPDTQGGPPVDLREADAIITFGAVLPALSNVQRLQINIELKYTGDVDADEPVDLWNSGSIEIVATDGSRLVARPLDTDADTVFESMQIEVGDESLLVPVTDGFLVNCRLQTLNGCSL